jgi:ribonuclease HII
MLKIEQELWDKGYNYIACIDEVGRGCLAGSLVTCAIIMPKGLLIEGVNDSKKLTPKKREELFSIITESAVAFGIGELDWTKVDEYNIKNATRLAMVQAVENLRDREERRIIPDYILVDAEKLNIAIPQSNLIHGDARCHGIAAASIVAKVNRYSMVQFETNRYSLPTMYVGERVTVKATADEVKILYKGAIIASHRRVYGQYQEEIKLDHYLELLLQKPRALDNTKVYKPNTLAPIYEQYRRSLNARNHKGNREFVRILMLHRDYPPALVTEAVEIAMAYNVYSYDGVLNILGQLLVSGRPKIVPVSKDKLQNIPEVVVIPPDLSKYSVLMSGGGK